MSLPASDADDDAALALRIVGCAPARERAVLIMTFYDDRPADAIAAELGLSPGNVRVIRHRCLERLRGCMEGAAA